MKTRGLFVICILAWSSWAAEPTTQNSPNHVDEVLDRWLKPADADLDAADVALQKLIPWNDFLYIEAATERKDLPEKSRKWLEKFVEREQPRYAARVKRQKRDDVYNQWFEKSALDKYEKIGRRDPKWDDLFKRGIHSLVSMPPDKKAAYEFFKKAVDLGCDDPYVAFLYADGVRHFGDRAQANEKLQAAAIAMANSKYSAAQKEAAALAAFNLFYSISSEYAFTHDNKMPPEYDQKAPAMVDSYFQRFFKMAREPGVPEEVLENVAMRMIELGGDGPNRKIIWDGVRPTLEWALPQSAVPLIVKGRFNILYAWDARGGDWANTVAPEGWKQMGERLAIARPALEKAWEMNPAHAEIANAMIWVIIGQGSPRDQMETWFDRAIAADPDNYEACTDKMNYIEPKWFGTPEAMLEFGHQCLDDANWNCNMPFILLEAHKRLAAYQNDTDKYWSDPKVWADIESVYTPLLKATGLNPEARSGHCWYACLSGHWDIARGEFTRLGDQAFPAEFGGKEAMEKFRKTAFEKPGEN